MSREISRRQFLKESAVVSLSVVATGLLGGCGVSADAAVSLSLIHIWKIKRLLKP